MNTNNIVTALKKWVEKEISPNTYAVLTVKQSVIAKWLVNGDRIIYENTFRYFIKGLTKRIFGCNTYKKRLFYLATLEGGDVERFHINLCIRRPDWLSLDDFRKMVSDEWQKLEWAMPQIYVEDRYADCVGYSLKEGSDSLLGFYNKSADSQGVLFRNRHRRRNLKRTWNNQGALTKVFNDKDRKSSKRLNRKCNRTSNGIHSNPLSKTFLISRHVNG